MKNNFSYSSKKTNADITKDIICFCMEFFFLYLSCKLIAVLLLTNFTFSQLSIV